MNTKKNYNNQELFREVEKKEYSQHEMQGQAYSEKVLHLHQSVYLVSCFKTQLCVKRWLEDELTSSCCLFDK